ncbi:hypothetical protein SSX86_007056 [Deinandra increscens subsp. villosa]|uniref:UBC core domain-containing protein n=1 Tax=Deinandra increscens subsp. villosa TaxID=3103831 RepID=A0AAP0H4D3_9ASTR
MLSDLKIADYAYEDCDEKFACYDHEAFYKGHEDFSFPEYHIVEGTEEEVMLTDAIDKEVEKKWEVMFVDGGDAFSDAMDKEVEKKWEVMFVDGGDAFSDAMDKEVEKKWEVMFVDGGDAFSDANAMDKEVEKKWEVMFVDGGDAFSDAMDKEVEKTMMGVFSYITTSCSPPEMYRLSHSPDIRIVLNERLPAEESWSRRSRFRAFSEKYRSSFLDLMECYVRAGVYQLEDVLPRYRQIVMRDDEDVLNRYEKFERFAKVADDPDHLFYKLHEIYTKDWEKQIREEWKILEKNLPGTIYVRAYESRMDLLRAVIIGPKGTPYHDGLFFFDVHFPPLYPYKAPILRYHSFGLAINPHMFKCGEVRFRITKTYCPEIPDLWLSGCTNVLELLLSIQKKILTEDPLFLQPGLLHSGASVVAEYLCLLYNEDILIRSLKTMMCIICNPPKHFEDFVVGHFRHRAHHILEACEAYMYKDLRAGAVVGSVGERNSCCSPEFQKNVESCVVLLTKCFEKIGATETKIYCQESQKLTQQSATTWKYLISAMATIMDQ